MNEIDFDQSEILKKQKYELDLDRISNSMSELISDEMIEACIRNKESATCVGIIGETEKIVFTDGEKTPGCTHHKLLDALLKSMDSSIRVGDIKSQFSWGASPAEVINYFNKNKITTLQAEIIFNQGGQIDSIIIRGMAGESSRKIIDLVNKIISKAPAKAKKRTINIEGLRLNNDLKYSTVKLRAGRFRGQYKILPAFTLLG